MNDSNKQALVTAFAAASLLGCGNHELTIAGLDLDENAEICLEWGLYDARGDVVDTLRVQSLVAGDEVTLDHFRRDDAGGTFAAGIWEVRPGCLSPCDAGARRGEADYDYCAPDYVAISDGQFKPDDKRTKTTIDVEPIEALSVAARWSTGDTRYVRRLWPRAGEPPGQLVVGPSLDEQTRARFSEVEKIALTPAAEGFDCSRESVTLHPRRAEENPLPLVRTDEPPEFVDLPGLTASAVCVSTSRYDVWGPWALVPVEFVASFAGKIAEREFPNPNQIVASAAVPAEPPPDLLSVGIAPEQVAVATTRPNDALEIETSAGHQWRAARITAGGLEFGKGLSAVFDTEQEAVVVVGPGEKNPALWIERGRAWELVTTDCDPEACPAGRTDFDASWDPGTGSLVLFGGRAVNEEAVLNDLWSFTENEWKLLSACAPGSDCPARRRDHSLVSASNTETAKLLLFGGRTEARGVGDTWTWDGTAWASATECGPDDPCPSIRWDHSMAFDSARDEVVLFGGQNAKGDLGDTWVWSSNSWTRLEEACEPTQECPAARHGHTMTFDARTQTTHLLGGTSAAADRLADRWIWDGERWRRVLDSCVLEDCPTAVSGHAATFDESSEEIVMLGGADNDTTWRLAVDDDATPAHLVRIALWASDLPIDALVSATIDVVAGGADGATESGATVCPLRACKDGDATLAEIPARGDTIHSTQIFTERPLDWVNDVDPRGETADFAITPSLGRGPNARVETDFFEARFVYNLAQ